MSDIKTWPVNGAILLRNFTPIASFQSLGEAIKVQQLYIHSELGTQFTIIYDEGYSTGRCDPKEDPLVKPKSKRKVKQPKGSENG